MKKFSFVFFVLIASLSIVGCKGDYQSATCSTGFSLNSKYTVTSSGSTIRWQETKHGDVSVKNLEPGEICTVHRGSK